MTRPWIDHFPIGDPSDEPAAYVAAAEVIRQNIANTTESVRRPPVREDGGRDDDMTGLPAELVAEILTGRLGFLVTAEAVERDRAAQAPAAPPARMADDHGAPREGM